MSVGEMGVIMVPLIFLLMIHRVSSADWAVNYNPPSICALKDSAVIMKCNYTYPADNQVDTVFWTKTEVRFHLDEYPDLSEDPEYSQRLRYLGDKQQNCTFELSNVTKKDEHKYYFRFITNATGGRWLGIPGLSLSVTDLQVESPERVKEGDPVRLTCKSSCKLTDTPTFIWYRNSQPLTEKSNELLLQSATREDTGRYRCSVDGYTLTSPELKLNVTYPPSSVSVSINGSSEIVSGDSVTLSCSSDSNPPALNFSWFKEETFVGSGRIFIISKISSDDSEKYKCGAGNEHGEEFSDPLTLNIMYPPRCVSVSISAIVSGDSVILKCSGNSNPPAEISWFKENQSSAVGSAQSFSTTQSGRFYCEARNPYGSERSDPVTVTFKVSTPPKIVSEIVSEDSVSLSCSSDSDSPALNFSCFKKNQSSVKNGHFYCEAHNPHGSQRSDAIAVPPKGCPVILYISIGVVCGTAAFIIAVIIWRRWIKRRSGNQLFELHYFRHHDAKRKDCDVDLNQPVYENANDPQNYSDDSKSEPN